MDFIKNQKLLKPLILLPAFLLLWCTSPNKQSNSIHLAKIADKQIIATDFLVRSRLTIRLANLNSQNPIFNHSISEKILMPEATGHRELSHTPALQSTLKGIQEQFMREKFHSTFIYTKVELDSQEVQNTSRLSMREYDTEFCAIQNTELATTFKKNRFDAGACTT